MGIRRRGWWACMERAGLIASLQDTRYWLSQMSKLKAFLQNSSWEMNKTDSLGNKVVLPAALMKVPVNWVTYKSKCVFLCSRSWKSKFHTQQIWCLERVVSHDLFLVGGKWDGCCVLALQNDERVWGWDPTHELEGMQTSGHANLRPCKPHTPISSSLQRIRTLRLSLWASVYPPTFPVASSPSSSWLLTGFWFFPGS